ncbi:MAG: 50S ribosomal protein L4 [Solirubrobacterales bacterium]
MAEAAGKSTGKAPSTKSAATKSAAGSSAAVKATVLDVQKTGRAGARPRTKADLPKEIFGEPFHEALVHEVARADLAARRRGTHSSLTRGEVAMTTAKAWRQKGTGRARAGALSVPHRYGGGAAFGPKPRHYTVKVNRKARRKALRAALSVHAERGSVAVLDGSTFSDPATRQAAAALGKWGAGSPTLVVIGSEEESVAKSFRNIDGVTVALAGATGVADVIGAASLVVSETALEELRGRASHASERPSSDAKPRAKRDEVSEEK